MLNLKLKNGFRIPLKGIPDRIVHKTARPDTLAVSPQRIPFIKPRLLVRTGDTVKIGTALFEDKRDTDIKYLSPGSGIVKDIRYGKRRSILEIIIQLSDGDTYESFQIMTHRELQQTDTEALIKQIKAGGLWQCLRQLPYRDTADSTQKPPAIIVSLNSPDIFSPRAGVYLKNREDDFQFGLEILNKLSERVLVTANNSELQELGNLKSHITHNLSDTYPAEDPAVFLYQIKKEASENSAWYINGQDLLFITELLKTGKYPQTKIITLTGPEITGGAHYSVHFGSPIKSLPGFRDFSRIITGGIFNGIEVTPDSHLGFFEDSVSIIKDSTEDEFFGFIKPGFNKLTVSRTFLSYCSGKPREYDCNIHGEERACINCGYCKKICPVDLYPNFIMKAILSDELEESLELGLLDCSSCGLCSYTCPSKIELAEILKNAMHAYYKDRF